MPGIGVPKATTVGVAFAQGDGDAIGVKDDDDGPSSEQPRTGFSRLSPHRPITRFLGDDHATMMDQFSKLDESGVEPYRCFSAGMLRLATTALLTSHRAPSPVGHHRRCFCECFPTMATRFYVLESIVVGLLILAFGNGGVPGLVSIALQCPGAQCPDEIPLSLMYLLAIAMVPLTTIGHRPFRR